MINAIRHPYRIIQSYLREKSKASARSPKWKEVRDLYVKNHQTCAACGSTVRIQVHHIEPYHLKPDLELDVNNLISLCFSKNECHLIVGHSGRFDHFNPFVEKDSLELLTVPTNREIIIERAKNNGIKIS